MCSKYLPACKSCCSTLVILSFIALRYFFFFYIYIDLWTGQKWLKSQPVITQVELIKILEIIFNFVGISPRILFSSENTLQVANQPFLAKLHSFPLAGICVFSIPHPELWHVCLVSKYQRSKHILLLILFSVQREFGSH